jgi:pimeloyl-ACP methyl ester carboxylesterase
VRYQHQNGQSVPVEVRDATTPDGRDSRQFARFRDDVARRTFLAAYDRTLAAWPRPPAQLDVETRYGSTHVLATGTQSGTPIVLLHATAVSSPSWFASIAALSEDRRVYAIDTIGDAGRSTQTSRIRGGDDMSPWLDEVLAELDLEKAHVVGLSYGGWLALNQARRSPDRLASITAFDPPGALGRPSSAFVIKILPDSLLAKFAKSDKALHRLIRLLNNGTLPAQPLLELSVAGLRTFRAQQPYPKRMSDDVLRMIDTPTLLLFCERSPVNRAERASERSRRLIADVETEVIPDAGHMLAVEKPELFTTRVLRFIHDVDTRHPSDE